MPSMLPNPSVYFRFTGMSTPNCFTLPLSALMPFCENSKAASSPSPTTGMVTSAIGPIKKPAILSL